MLSQPGIGVYRKTKGDYYCIIVKMCEEKKTNEQHKVNRVWSELF